MKEGETVLGHRLHELETILGKKQRAMAALLCFDESTLSSWKKRTDRDPDYRSLMRVSQTLHLSLDYLSGATERLTFSPDIMDAQRALRMVSADSLATDTNTVASRLLRSWELFRALVPTLSEAVWLAYLHWGESDWAACRDGLLQPTSLQLEWAAMLTGLPETWFRSGDPVHLDTARLEQYAESNQLAYEEGLDGDDLIRLIRKNKTPRR